MNEVVRTIFPSDPKFLECVYSLTEKIAGMAGFDSHRRYNLVLAVSEGFTNAFLHGNQGRYDRSIVVEFERGEDFLRVSIQDEGILPIDNSVDTRSTLAMSEAVSGRGLALIAKFVDQVAIWHDPELGNTLSMTMTGLANSGNKDIINKVEVADGNHTGNNWRVHNPSTERKA